MSVRLVQQNPRGRWKKDASRPRYLVLYCADSCLTLSALYVLASKTLLAAAVVLLISTFACSYTLLSLISCAISSVALPTSVVFSCGPSLFYYISILLYLYRGLLYKFYSTLKLLLNLVKNLRCTCQNAALHYYAMQLKRYV